MKLTDRYSGRDDPFEGDRTLWLRGLPAGASATRATITLEPVAAPGRGQFEEGIAFLPDTQGAPGTTQGTLGATKVVATGSVEVDFHARRTLAKVTGSTAADATPLTGASLQVNPGGGVYVEVNQQGALKAPGDTLFSLLNGGALPGLTVTAFKLMHAEKPDVTEVVIRSVPANVTARLGQQPPFWARPGELTVATVTPDFAPALNTFLAASGQAPQDGFYAIPLMIHSDAITRLDVQIEVEYTVEQAILPPHLPEITLPYGFSTAPGVDAALTTITLPRRAVPVSGRTSATIRGEFQGSRVALGPIGTPPPTVAVEVSPACSVAQAFRADAEAQITGIDLPLGRTQPGLAGLNVAIQTDDDGKPSGEILASAEVRVDKPLPGQSAWGTATLAAAFRVQPAVRYWLVLQSRAGQASWEALRGSSAPPAIIDPTLQCTRDGGLSWRPATVPGSLDPLAALLRLRHQPDRFTIPVQLQVGQGPVAVLRRLDEFAPIGRVEFAFDFAAKLGEHLRGLPPTQPCPPGELLVNGSFDAPPHDNAARRLFGRETDSGQTLTGNVDLSRGVDLSAERYITLRVGDVGPIIIDCAGRDPAHTKAEEVKDAINAGFDPDVANIDGGQLMIDSGASKTATIYPWCRAHVPTGWQRISGSVRRLLLEGQIFVLLPSPSSLFEQSLPSGDADDSDTGAAVPAMISQGFSVVGGCTYSLAFDFWAMYWEDMPHYMLASAKRSAILSPLPASFKSPSWSLDWLDAAGNVISTEKGDLLKLQEGATIRNGLLPRGEIRLAAPAAAASAELAFVQPPQGFLLLDNVSVMARPELLGNAAFGQWIDKGQGRPAEWTLVSGWADHLDDAATGERGIKLRGDRSDDAVIAQSISVAEGVTYSLEVQARPERPVADENLPKEQRARLELRWLAAGQSSVPVLLPLDGRDFPRHAWTGVAPAGATHAEIRLIQPAGKGNLRVSWVSLAAEEQIAVPLTFLAEAPGELTLSGLRVGYDLPGDLTSTRGPSSK